ncbi:S41 family peptidase [Ekhidna sp.]|uniref:S41 family peptidase n=1 Tax=Ekhidna sp. TaxID=2608089 RepID=UPI003C7D0DD6
MRVVKLIVVLVISGIWLNGCGNGNGLTIGEPLENEVNEFVWSAMNVFYYWQADVPNLSDSKNDFSLNSFLNSYSTPESLFDDLLYEDDRFSWIVNDYEELEASFQGVSKSFGYDLGLVRISSESDDLMAYIKYVVPGGPAEDAGLKRGDIFTQVNGAQLTVDNYISTLFQSTSYTLTLATIQDNTISQTDQEVSLTAEELSENPILLSEVLEVDGVKVGYLMYNQFINNNAYHEELNNAIGSFNSAGISDIVLDLRYNGGGSLLTSRILASMLYGNASSNDVLGSIIYNNKLAEFNNDLSFLTSVPVFDSGGEQTSSLQMNRLNLNRIFILTSGSSASASEFIIAGLQPYMDVTLIGTTTVGKNVGSVTLYDSDDYLKSGALNPNHKYAIQPIISQLANSVGFTDYIDGFDPDIEVNEVDYLEDLKPLGDPSEPLLAEALGVITGVARIERPRDSGMEVIRIAPKQTETILLDDENVPKFINSLMLD